MITLTTAQIGMLVRAPGTVLLAAVGVGLAVATGLTHRQLERIVRDDRLFSRASELLVQRLLEDLDGQNACGTEEKMQAVYAALCTRLARLGEES